MRYFKPTIVFLTCFFCFNAMRGQLSVTPNSVANTLAQTIAGFGVTVSNASISCTSAGAGTFTYTGTHLGLTSGVILTTGNATTAAQPQSTNSSTDNGNNIGDPQLVAIESSATHNLCKLEFDFVPICPNLSIKYVFASEEYPTFVGSVNDVFGIFLTGPNPSGPAYNNQNIALLPNGTPVSINNVNASSNSSSFVANYNLNYSDIVYGGYTTPITSTASLTPCQSYHIKFAIADASDGLYDSGVFIQYDGLSCTNSPTVTPHSQASSCSVNTGSASVTVTGLTPTSYSWQPGGQSGPSITNQGPGTYTCVMSFSSACTTFTQSQVITITSPGTTPTVAVSSNTPCPGTSLTFTTASNGTSYAWSGPNSFSSSTQNPSISGVTAANSGVYTLTVTNASGCTKTTTLNVNISASSTITVSSATICSGNSATLTASGASTYTWSGPSLSTSSGSIVVASPGSSASYTVSGSIGSCSATPGIGNVTVTPTPTATIGSNSPICVGATLNLTSGGGTTYAWSGPAAYTSSAQNPSISSASVANTGVYTVTVTTNTCKGTNTVNVSVVAAPTVAVSSNTPCPGNTMSLTATSNGTSYSWSGPSSFTSSSQNPTIGNASAANSGVYTLTVSNATGCTTTITLNASISAASSPTAVTSGTICAGQTLTLSTSSAGVGGSYQWAGPNGFTSSVQSPAITNAPTANSGVYSVTVTSSAGCSGTTTANALVNANPTPTVGSNSPVCVGATLSLTASGGTTYVWSGPGAYTSSVQNPAIASTSVANSGVYTVTATTSGCTGTNTISVNVVASPTMAVSSNTPCAGATLSLTASSNGTSYSWSGPGGYTSSSQNPAISNASSAISGVYTLTVSNATGCTSTTTLNASINAASSPTAASSGTICAGQTLTLTTTSAGGTFQWSGPNGFSSAAQSPSIANASTANSGVYTVTVTSSAGCTGTTSVSALVNPTPTVTIGSNSPVCAGTTLSLTASGGTGYAWSGPNGYTSSSQNPAISPAATTDSGVYTVTVTSQGCTNTNTVNTTVNAIPTPTASSNSPVCQGSTLNLSAGGGTTYSWSGPNSYASSSQNPSVTNASTSGSGTYTVTATTAGCTGSATVNVTVNPTPTVTAGSNAPICAGSTLSLTASGGTTYAWSGPNSFTSTQQNPVIASATTADGGVYTATATASGCSATATVNVTINAAIVASITLSSPACLNSNVNLTAPNGGSTYAWTGPNGFSSASQNPSINNVTNADAGVYTLSITTLGCVSTATANLSTVAPVSFSVTPTSQAVCKNHSAGLSSLGQGGTGNYAYNWSPAVGITSPSSPSVTATPAATQTYTVTLGDAGCPTAPTATAAVTVTVNPLPVITFSAPSVAGCEPFCTSFSSSSAPAAQTASWVFSDGQTATGTSISSLCFNTHGNYDAKLIVQDVNGCTDSLSKPGYITVYPKPIADFTWDPLTPTIITNDVTFYDQSKLGTPMQSWSWNFGDFFVPASGNNSTLQNPEHVFQNLGTYSVSLIVVNQYGCRDSITKKITVEDEYVLYIPNAFSPSIPDGVNDVFGVKGTGFYADSFEMYIFDRWGEQIFYTNDVMKGWDGSYKGGGPRVKQDVYVYKIIVKDFKDKKRQYVGHVTLL